MSESLPVALRRGLADRAEQRRQYLAFTVGRETFAIETTSLKEVIPFGGLTEIPLMPESIRGVINLRGSVVPVVDLAVRFGRALTVPTRKTCIVVLEQPGRTSSLELGLVVDSVCEVLELGSADIEPAPQFGSGLRSDFISGVGKVEGRFVIILEVSAVLSLDELAALEEAQSASGAPELPAP